MDFCVFCEIVAGRIPSTKVYEDDKVFAFRDINPQAPVHVLIIPKKHIRGADALTAADDAVLCHMFAVARRLAAELGVAETGYRLITNIGADGGQTVMHLHMHVLGGASLGEGLIAKA